MFRIITKINIEIMPMIKSYTLSYCINTYQNIRLDFKKVDFVGMEGDNMLQNLHPCSFSPSEKSIQMILNFSKSYDVMHSSITNTIEVNKN